MPKIKPGEIRPSNEEEATITAAALSDPDNPPLTAEDFAAIGLRGQVGARQIVA